MYGYPGLGYGFGLEGPYKRRRSMRRRAMVFSLVVGCALTGAAFFFGGGL